MLLSALAFVLATHLVPPTATDYKQPQLAASDKLIAVTFGSGNAIYFSASFDQGATFSEPRKIAERGVISLGNHRGPRVAITKDAIVISAIAGQKGKGADGDLFTWRSLDNGRTWLAGGKINDEPGAPREGLHAMAAGPDGSLFAAWLDLRHVVAGKPGTELYGAYSTDDGATWSRNTLIYKSPDGSICTCCHPSAVFANNGEIEVMWRNALSGSRDMYIASSADGGKTFATLEKLGGGTWPLQACPMDGGALAITQQGKIMSTWRRGGDVFIAPAGGIETLIHEGKNPSIASNSGGLFVAWSGPDGVFARVPGNSEPVTLDHDGGFVQLIAVPHGPVLASWERKGTIQFHTLR